MMLSPPTLDSIKNYRVSSNRWVNIPWGPKSWKEVTLNGKVLYQVFDIDIPTGTPPANGWPLMINFHPNGMSRFIRKGSYLDKVLVQACLNAGIAVATVEFRHPVVNKTAIGAKYLEAYNDPGIAIQNVKALHVALNLDLNNVGLVCKSRGSLAFFSNLFADLAKGDALTYAGTLSTKVRAVWISNGQSIHKSLTAAEAFVIEEDRDDFLEVYPNNPKLLDQVELVLNTTNILPKLHVVSEQAYFYDKQPAAIVLENPLHYPDMMRLLVEAYQYKNNPNISFNTNVPGDQSYAGLVDWFLQ